MKKLICVEEVKAVAAKGQKTFCLQGDTIITPAAKDLAKELGVEFITSSSVTKAMCKNSALQKNDTLNKNIDKDLIYQVVKAVLANNLLANAPAPSSEGTFRTDYDSKSGLKIVRGRTVRYKTFDTGRLNTNVAYREVLKNDNSKMSAGFLTIEKSSFDWELCNDEINIILEGSLSININGNTYEACQGDVLLIPKGSKVTWGSSEYVKLFYVTANWADLMVQQ